MRSTLGIVVLVNRLRRIAVVRVANERHAVIGHEDREPLELGDVLIGDFGATGAVKLQNLITGESLVVHTHVVDSSLREASLFSS
jgi:hypothetical protein